MPPIGVDKSSRYGEHGRNCQGACESLLHGLLEKLGVTGDKEESSGVCEQSRDQSHPDRNRNKSQSPVTWTQAVRIVCGFLGERPILWKEEERASKGENQKACDHEQRLSADEGRK